MKMSDLKWYTVNIPVLEGSALDRRIQALCQDGSKDEDQHIVQMAVVTGVADHMHRNLGIMEREREQS